jgi:hypothetical protein
LGPENDSESVLEQLLGSPEITRSSLTSVPTDQGVYVLWLRGAQPQCLKVGIAGPRQGKGLRARLGNHYSSHTSNSVLARHLAADSTSPWSAGLNFTRREQRQAFLCDRCYFQVLAVQASSRRDLEHLESKLINRLGPIYLGKVDKLHARSNH